MPLIIIPVVIAAHIGSAEPTFKFRLEQYQRGAVVAELVHSAPSSSEFQSFGLERPIFRPLGKL
jgi:hypothetical protein